MAKEIVAVIGAAQTKFKTHYADKTYIELAQDAAKQAMDDAGVTPDKINGAFGPNIVLTGDPAIDQPAMRAAGYSAGQ